MSDSGEFDVKAYNAKTIQEFRANGGRVADFGDAPVVILHTTGAKSGIERETPLVAQVDGDRLIVFGSKAGAPTHPDWFRNLVADPSVTVEFGSETFAARAVELEGDERDARFDAQVAAVPVFADYAVSAGDRQIPVIALERA